LIRSITRWPKSFCTLGGERAEVQPVPGDALLADQHAALDRAVAALALRAETGEQ
jgi:hypothetical protein